MSQSEKVLPPGFDDARFQAILTDLSAIVGDENVSKDNSTGSLEGPHKQQSYGDPYSLTPKKERLPSAAVRPSSTKEVQEIIKLANKSKFPVWVVSRGKNLGYGGTAPVVHGSVLLDLHRMNKIIEVNEEYAYAIVEPGVSFFDLYNYVQEKKLALWPSCPAIGWGSVLGNTLDRGIGYTPGGEHTAQQCGMEVVLPTGELLRTGSGAMKDNKSYALFKGGFGPSVDGLFFQSNLGVVTQLGIHLTPAPECYMSCEVSVPKEEDLPLLLGALSGLMRRNIIQNSPSVSNLFRQSLFAGTPAVLQQVGPHFGEGKYVPGDVLEKVRAEQGWGFWKSQFALYGPPEIVLASWKAVENAFSTVDKALLSQKTFHAKPGQLLTTTEIGPEQIPHTGIPTLEPFKLMEYRGGERNGHICYSPIIPPSGRELYAWYLTAKQRTIDANFDFFADFHVFGRYIIAIELVVFTPSEGPRCDALYRNLLADGAAQGYGEYRTHVDYMDEVASHFDFNDGALLKYVQNLKDTLDPNGILSPGKSGIWNSNSPLRSKTQLS